MQLETARGNERAEGSLGATEEPTQDTKMLLTVKLGVLRQAVNLRGLDNPRDTVWQYEISQKISKKCQTQSM